MQRTPFLIQGTKDGDFSSSVAGDSGRFADRDRGRHLCSRRIGMAMDRESCGDGAWLGHLGPGRPIKSNELVWFDDSDSCGAGGEAEPLSASRPLPRALCVLIWLAVSVAMWELIRLAIAELIRWAGVAVA